MFRRKNNEETTKKIAIQNSQNQFFLIQCKQKHRVMKHFAGFQNISTMSDKNVYKCFLIHFTKTKIKKYFIREVINNSNYFKLFITVIC